MKITDIIIPVSTKYGAPMGRPNVLTAKKEFISQETGKTFTTISGGRIYVKKVPMCKCCGAYDIGGAYWGCGPQLMVKYNNDLTYVEYYRLEN